MNKQTGFTLVEMMIALFIGGLVLGGVMFTYLSMKVTTRDTMTIGELQETGRLAINILQRDIEQVGFWGTFYDVSFTSGNTTVPATPSPDCFAGINNASFPDLASVSNFHSIYSMQATNANALNCITDAKEDTDVLQLKFLQGLEIDPATTAANRYYFVAEQEKATFMKGPVNGASFSGNATTWHYSHHVYYISERSYEINDQTVSVPVLMRRRLSANSSRMRGEPIMEGVEDMRFVFGLDTNSDNRVDTYRSNQQMTITDWTEQREILTVQVFLLVRALTPDADLKVNNQTYTLGEDANRRQRTFTDNYRRAVFTTTIRLNNVGANLWSI